MRPSYPRRIIRSAIKDRTNSSADFGDAPKPTSRSFLGKYQAAFRENDIDETVLLTSHRIDQYCEIANATAMMANPIVMPKSFPKNLCCLRLSWSIADPVALNRPAFLFKTSPAPGNAMRLVPGLQGAHPHPEAIVSAELQ